MARTDDHYHHPRYELGCRVLYLGRIKVLRLAEVDDVLVIPEAMATSQRKSYEKMRR